MFSVRHVDPSLNENQEQLGTKRKYWFRDSQDGPRLLFKAEERGTGEDWAEKTCCELAALLGLPHVHYELAEEMVTKKPGVVCPSCAIPPKELVLGNQMLLAMDDAYPTGDVRKFKVKAHTIAAVSHAMKLLLPPPEEETRIVPTGVTSALDVFVGYILLDAWTANQDRHHENWGVLWDKKDIWLAPTFDHGSALARNITDDERKDRLESRDRQRQIPAFAAKARSAFFDVPNADRPLSTYQAWRGFAALAPAAAIAWRGRLASIDEPTVRGVLEKIPPARMSAIGRDFTMALLAENRRRILANESE